MESIGGAHGQILLVGEDQEESVAELVLVQHALQLLTGLDNTIPIVAVDHEDDTLGVLEVVAPQRTNLVLTTDIPHGELNVLVFDGLDVEACTKSVSNVGGGYANPARGWRGGLTDRGDGGDDFTKFELVEDGGLTGGIKTDHQDSHLLATP